MQAPYNVGEYVVLRITAVTPKLLRETLVLLLTKRYCRKIIKLNPQLMH
jgi:hypothetical protein